MLRRSHRIGPWLLLAALFWYVAACFLADNLNKQSLEQGKSSHKAGQDFDIGEGTAVVIRVGELESKSGYLPRVQLVFDASFSQATIQNANVGLAVNGALVENTLNISLEKTKARHNKSVEDLVIHLPVTVNKVSFSGFRKIDVSGSFPAPTANLVLEILEPGPSVTLKRFKVNRLLLAAVFKPTVEKISSDTGFVVDEQVVIADLGVSMTGGTVEFLSRSIPQQTRLDLAEAVKIKADAAFLRTARFE